MKEMGVIVGLSVLSFLKVRDPYYFCFYNSGEDDYEKYAEDNEKRDAIAKWSQNYRGNYFYIG